jgi:hypothetical protein
VRTPSGTRPALGGILVAAALAAGGCRLPEPEPEGTFVTLVSADAALAERVERALAAEGVPTHGIQVRVVNGVVALGGDVPSDADRRVAEAVARAVEDVRGVYNELVVASPPTAAAPGLGGRGSRLSHADEARATRRSPA